ncbi:MAG: hypothetical protein IJF21_01260, partial [Clostridia bacterium]|nr:hypothetical protein [Clostridia bacterium]
AKISPEGKILLLPNGRQGRRPFEAQGREQASLAGLPSATVFAVCGRRLKELFEKSSLRNFKNFQHAIVVKLLEMVEKRKMSF